MPTPQSFPLKRNDAEAARILQNLVDKISELRADSKAKSEEADRKRGITPPTFGDDHDANERNYLSNKMLDMVTSARNDIDLLRIYQDHLLNQDTVHRVDVLYRAASVVRSSYDYYPSVFSAIHIDRLASYEAAFEESPPSLRINENKIAYLSTMRRAAILGDHKVSSYIISNIYSIGNLVKERDIKDYTVLIALVSEISFSKALIEGTL